MKKYYLVFIFYALTTILFEACEDQVLDKIPLDSYSEETVWSDVKLANLYLLDNYTCLKADMDFRTLSHVTDESHMTHDFGQSNYLQGNITADNPQPFGLSWAGGDYFVWSTVFGYIQNINTFIDKIDNVTNHYSESEKSFIQEQTDIMKGEAYFLRAFCYLMLACNYGGVPIMEVPNELNFDFLSVERNTFEETINFIATDCDSAFELLGDDMEMGRATKGAALTLKSRVLLFAASDLVADGTAVNDYVGYSSPNRTALWTAARNAAKAVIDLDVYELEDFGAPDRSAVSENYFQLFKAKDLSSSEIIWGKMFLPSTGATNNSNRYHGSNGFADWGCTGPLQNLVDAYQMADGSDFFDHFMLDDDNYYRNISSKYTNDNIYHNRDPRLYGTVLHDSAKWLNRYEDLIERDPLGIYDRRTRITIQNGEEINKIYGIDTKKGPVDPDDGTLTGYIMKKQLDDEVYTRSSNNENIWIEMRYAEVLLNYAEACLELGQEAEAATYINMIRNRAAMPDLEGDIREALRYERHIELAFEAKRWYDIRRWKILDEALVDAMGIDIVETNNLDNSMITTTWRQIQVQERGPVQDKMYWMPIPTDEINRAPQIVNNPGY